MAEDEAIPESPFADVLQTHPPGRAYKVPDLLDGSGFRQAPQITLHCTDPHCERLSLFSGGRASFARNRQRAQDEFLDYTCNHCQAATKTFALRWISDEIGKGGLVLKIGEIPDFGPPIPARVITLVGADRELLINGYRSEKRSLGIGAFAYYRRVVEGQKDRILGEVIRVAKTVKSPREVLESLEKAKAEQLFADSLKTVHVPDMLLIDGENPLQLLHTALSDGLHGRTDGECLESARAARVVLFELADRMQIALKEVAELKDAVKVLRRAPQKKSPPPPA